MTEPRDAGEASRKRGDDSGVVSGGGGLGSRLAAAAADIKLAHSVFALPFAVLAAFLAFPIAGPGWPGTDAGTVSDAGEGWVGWDGGGGWGGGGASVLPGAGALAVTLALVVGCMVSARTFAMLINRLADRRFDAMNPRTARRALPAGAMTGTDAVRFAAVSAAAFVVLCAGFSVWGRNPWPLALSVPVLGWLALYSYTKRFTLACHFVLGLSLAMSPPAAALAIRPASLDPWAAPVSIWLLALMVAAWVAGFDAIYALQDERFDRAHGLRSIPARFGAGATIRAARVLHVVALAALVGAGLTDPRLGWVFGIGVTLVGVLLACEHAVLARRGGGGEERNGLHPALFTLNGVVSCVVGAMGVIDTLV